MQIDAQCLSKKPFIFNFEISVYVNNAYYCYLFYAFFNFLFPTGSVGNYKIANVHVSVSLSIRLSVRGKISEMAGLIFMIL